MFSLSPLASNSSPAFPVADVGERQQLADKSRSDLRPSATERDDLTAHLPGGDGELRDQNGRSGSKSGGP
jgi:hypothetical protein